MTETSIIRMQYSSICELVMEDETFFFCVEQNQMDLENNCGMGICICVYEGRVPICVCVCLLACAFVSAKHAREKTFLTDLAQGLGGVL